MLKQPIPVPPPIRLRDEAWVGWVGITGDAGVASCGGGAASSTADIAGASRAGGVNGSAVMPSSGFPINSSLAAFRVAASRSEEHTSELQSRLHLVCRLLLEKKNKQ